MWRTAGFVIFDEVEGGDALVHLEWLMRPYNIFEPDQVEMRRRAFDNLLAASVTGDDARELITMAPGTCAANRPPISRRVILG
jgi:hypothetical protein